MKFWPAWTLGLIVATSGHPLLAQNDVCIPASGVPTMDGLVVGDPGWDGSARVDLDPPGTPAQTWLRLTRDASHVYLGFVVKSADVAPNPDDRVVLGFFATQPQAAWRIHIQPFGLTAPLGAGNPAAVQFWRDSAAWNGNAVVQTPSSGNAPWLMPAQIPTFTHAGSHWEMELKVPIVAVENTATNGVFFPPAGGATFRLYVNVINVASGFSMQHPWKTSSTISGSLAKGTPATGAWGFASFDDRPGCAVQLYCTKLGLIAPPSPSVHQVVPYSPSAPFPDCASIAELAEHPTTGPVNTFFAKPRNRGAAAANVKVEFKVSDFGVPGPDDWWRIGYPEGWTPALANPGPEITLAAGQEGLTSVDWALTFKQSCQLHVPFKSIRATMQPGTVNPPAHFGANPVDRCYETGSASVFERDARIGTLGWPAPAGGKQGFVLVVKKDVVRRPPAPAPVPPRVNMAAAARRPTLADIQLYEDAAEVARRAFPPSVDETLNWVCRAYRKTGQTLEIDGRTFEDTAQAGSFGYLTGHRGPVERWSADFSGAGLRRKSDAVFELDVTQGQKGLVHTRIEAESFYAWALRARVGAAIPHGDFADAVDGGWSELVSLEYRINRMFSVEGRLGVSMFDGESGGPDVYSVQHSINGRATFREGPLRPFVNAGPGFYANNPGDDDFGFNAGAGLGYRLSDRLALEAAWDYHHVFAEGDDPRFSTLQVGVGLKF